jgi:predicted acylesterase/phospholipase RssA
MCIADAVRISISIPGIFKPVALTTKPCADEVNLETMLLFVDGGVLNNNPIHAFDNLRRKRIVPKAETLIFGNKYNPETKITRLNKKLLGLRLTDPSSAKVQRFDNGLSMFGWIIELMISQNEMSQIRTLKEAEQTIDLDTRGLDILEFKVDREKLEMITDKIYTHTMNWLEEHGSIFMKK